MIAKNAEIKAPGTWRNEEASKLGSDADERSGIGQASRQIGYQPISTDRDDRKGRNSINQCGQATIGGIIDRLISKTLKRIQECENEAAEFKKQLEELKEISNQLKE